MIGQLLERSVMLMTEAAWDEVVRVRRVRVRISEKDMVQSEGHGSGVWGIAWSLVCARA